ncbi:bifunctional glycosyltransferase/CDP-glycerol:glycerophosphate glycerophosphotransferase [Glutamicibacter sp. BSL13]
MPKPIFSAVIAAYQIENYANDLFRSIEEQTLDDHVLEVIVIDDGSKDRTLEKARRWAHKSRFTVTVETQENAGVAAARNRGIDLANGEWIAFVDSDDVLDRSYFLALAEFLKRDVNNAASMLTSRSLIFNERKGIAQDNHPLAWKYRRGDRLVSLLREPHVIHLGGHSTIVKSNIVHDNNIRFSPLVKPAFEDAHFIGIYLAQFKEPVLGLVASARYYYRKRANGSSLIDTTWTKTEKFTNEPKYGHLGLLEYLSEHTGSVPVWAQNMVLYSLYWYFRADRSLSSPLKNVPQELLDEFWNSLYKIFEYIDADVIRAFNLVDYGWALKEGILKHFKNESIVSSKNIVGYMWNADDIHRSTRKIGYSYVGTLPSERIFLEGQYSEHAITKSMRHEAFGRTLMYERIIILPRVSKVEIYLDTQKLRIVKPQADRKKITYFQGSPPRLQLSAGIYKQSASELVRKAKHERGVAQLRVGAKALWLKIREESWITGKSVFRVAYRVGVRLLTAYRGRLDRKKLKKADLVALNIANSFDSRRKYEDAWIIADHPARADDNGEHFYRYLMKEHPATNAFFLIKRSSPDWDRLVEAGFRLIEYRSQEAVNAALNAKYIISSHIDAGIYDPVSRQRFGPSPARRIFLQHGMVMNDLSRWLNTKGLALMISSSPYEYEHFAGNESAYKFTPKEVVLTGLPRHDALVRAKSSFTGSRRYLSFIPTWRQALVSEIKLAGSRDARRKVLESSDFFISWKKLVSNEKLMELCLRKNLEIRFVLHDHFAPYSDLFDFGPRVKVMSFKNVGVQNFLINNRVVITDYSSIATEAAISGSPVAYYQFDKESIYGNGHTFSRGWFDYDCNGFGPVLTESTQVVDWLEDLISLNWTPSSKYISRLEETLPYLDGRACERVFEAIGRLDENVFEETEVQF